MREKENEINFLWGVLYFRKINGLTIHVFGKGKGCFQTLDCGRRYEQFSSYAKNYFSVLCHTPYGLDKRTALPVDGGISYGFWCCLIFLPLVLLLFLFVCFFFLSSRCDINFVRERLEKVTTDPGVEVSTPHSVSEQTSGGYSLLSFSCSPHFLLLLFS